LGELGAMPRGRNGEKRSGTWGKKGRREREGSSRATQQRGHGGTVAARGQSSEHVAERGWAARERGKRPKRERARERWRSGRIDPTVGPARRERRWTGYCGWPARRWGPLAAGREV
jgi:hypothetical protein